MTFYLSTDNFVICNRSFVINFMQKNKIYTTVRIALHRTLGSRQSDLFPDQGEADFIKFQISLIFKY